MIQNLRNAELLGFSESLSGHPAFVAFDQYWPNDPSGRCSPPQNSPFSQAWKDENSLIIILQTTFNQEKPWNPVKTPWDTVGSEIRRSPVEVGSWNPIIYRVLGPSQVVVWDFWTINSIITPQVISTLHFQHRSWPMPLEAMWASHPMERSCLVVSLAHRGRKNNWDGAKIFEGWSFWILPIILPGKHCAFPCFYFFQYVSISRLFVVCSWLPIILVPWYQSIW